MPNLARELKGYTVGYLTVVRRAGYSTRYGVVWVLQCRCGNKLERTSSDIARLGGGGRSRVPVSCGCARSTHRSHLYKGVGDLSSTRWKRVKKHAERKGFQFKITMKYAWDLFLRQGKRCALSGVGLTMSPNDMSKGVSTASLDRIDSTKGYVRGNVQWVHVVVNDLKSNMPQDEFIRWCRLISKGRKR